MDASEIKTMLAAISKSVESVTCRFNQHADKEEHDRKLEIEERQAIKNELRALREDLSPYIKGRRTANNLIEFSTWLGKLGLIGSAIGVAVLWVWSHWLQPVWTFLTK